MDVLFKTPLAEVLQCGRAWNTKFLGEGGIDAGAASVMYCDRCFARLLIVRCPPGALYHDSVSEICAELMSDALPLFIPSPNSCVRRHRLLC